MIKTNNILIKLLQWIPIFGLFCLFEANEKEGFYLKMYNLFWVITPTIFSILYKLLVNS